MNRTWRYRYDTLEERQEMIDAVRSLVEAGHNVWLGTRHPPGVIIVHGDEDGVFMAGLSKPVEGFIRD